MKKLFVGNLPYGANETDVQGFFEVAGVPIDNVTVMRDRFTGQARGFGFVEINDDGGAQKAVDACNGKELMGVRGSTCCSVFNIGPGAPGGVSEPWAKAVSAQQKESNSRAGIFIGGFFESTKIPGRIQSDVNRKKRKETQKS